VCFLNIGEREMDDPRFEGRDWQEDIKNRVRESIDDLTVDTVAREWLVSDLMGMGGKASEQLSAIALQLLSASKNGSCEPVVINPQQFSEFSDFINRMSKRYSIDRRFSTTLKDEIIEEESNLYSDFAA
jgi:hypothetical protein